jgi:hypothetical protein
LFWILSKRAQTVVDTADGVIFFDLNGPISFDGVLTSWSIYANQNGGAIRLLIYRDTGTNWTYVGSSAMENVASVGMNTFDLASTISVLTGDHLAFWYPDNNVPSVAYSPDTGQTVNNYDWPWEPIVDLTAFMGDIPDMSAAPLTWLETEWVVNSRTYSINVSGTPVPIPGAAWLLGSGLFALAGRRMKSIRT